MSSPEQFQAPPIKFELLPSQPIDHEKRENLDLGQADTQAVLDGGPSSEFAVNPVAAQAGTVAVKATVSTDDLPLAA